MTPDQENELVARWMGWEYFSPAKSGMTTGEPPHWRAPKEHFRLGSKVYRCPPYRTDPALNRDLEVRLCEQHGWNFYCSVDSEGAVWHWNQQFQTVYRVPQDTLAEAVFAAAVVQAQYDKAEQEGK